MCDVSYSSLCELDPQFEDLIHELTVAFPQVFVEGLSPGYPEPAYRAMTRELAACLLIHSEALRSLVLMKSMILPS